MVVVIVVGDATMPHAGVSRSTLANTFESRIIQLDTSKTLISHQLHESNFRRSLSKSALQRREITGDANSG